MGHAYLSPPPRHRRRARRGARTRRLSLAQVGLEVLDGSQGRRHVSCQVHHGRQVDVARQLALGVQRGLGPRHACENLGDVADLSGRALAHDGGGPSARVSQAGVYILKAAGQQGGTLGPRLPVAARRGAVQCRLGAARGWGLAREPAAAAASTLQPRAGDHGNPGHEAMSRTGALGDSENQRLSGRTAEERIGSPFLHLPQGRPFYLSTARPRPRECPL